MSLAMLMSIAIVVGAFCFSFFFFWPRLTASAKRGDEDLVQLVKERRPTLEDSLERWESDQR